MQEVQFVEVVRERSASNPWLSSDVVVLVLMLAEFLIVVSASMLAQAAYAGPGREETNDIAIGALAGFLYIFMAQQLRLYKFHALLSLLSHARLLMTAILVSIFAVVVAFFFMKTGQSHSRLSLFIFLIVAIFALLAFRGVVSAGVRRALAARLLMGRRVVMIGEKEELSCVDTQAFLHFGIDEVARYEIALASSGLGDRDRRLVARAIEAARMSHAVEFALLLNWQRDQALDDVLSQLRESPLPVRLYPDLRTRDILQRHRGSAFNPDLSVELQRAPLRRGERALKRVFDFCAALVVLVMLSPLLVAVAALIKATSPGPAIFRQRRMGFDQRVFTIFKFRTMSVLEDGAGLRQAQRGDPRITKLGRLLRQTSIDELPQLLNVLRGDMSLVGPRPHALAHDAEYSTKIAEYARRHHVKPGLTGAAQIRGLRGETQTLKHMADRVEWDLWYINNWSFLLDIRILAQTFFTLLSDEAF